MGFLSYGSGKALSYTHDFQKDIDRLYQREAYRGQVQAEKERKTQFYASLTKEATAAAPYNTKRLEELYGGLHKELADFAIDNPDYETDITKMSKYQGIADRFLNNPIIAEDQQVQQQWNATKEAYNNGNLKQSEYDANAEKYIDYTENGGDPYVFANPKRKDMMEILQDINQYLQPHITEKVDKITGKITKTTETPEVNIHLAAVMGLRDPDIDFVISQKYNEIPEADKGLYSTKTDYFEHLIRAGELWGEEDAGYDAKILAAYKKSLDDTADMSDYTRFYYNDIYTALAEKGETASNLNNVVFSEFSTLKNPITMGVNGRNFKAYGEGNAIGDLNIQGHVASIGAGKIINYGGVPWVQIQVAVSIDDEQVQLDAEGKPIILPAEATEDTRAGRKKAKSKEDQVIQAQMLDGLKKYGFTTQKVTDPDILAALGGETITSDVYVGTVLMPADFSEPNRRAYDLAVGTTKEKLSKAAPLYGEGLNVMEVIQSGNPVVASSMINARKLKSISTMLGRDVGQLSWEQDNDDPNVWYSMAGEDPIRYDFFTDKYSIAENE